MQLTISYFHTKIGPMVYYTYPSDNNLVKEDKSKLADMLDQAFEEGFFTHGFGDLTSLNYYFEIDSEWARGKKEMLLVSIINDKIPIPEIEEKINKEFEVFVSRLKKIPTIFKSFYHQEDTLLQLKSSEETNEILKNFENLKFLVKELYWDTLEHIREKSDEEKWAKLMSNPAIFKIIQKLSRGPLPKDMVQQWFATLFPKYDFDTIVGNLIQEKFLFENNVAHEIFLLLVKDVEIMRVPPDCVIDLIEDSPELIDLTSVYIHEVSDFFDTYSQNPLDSLDLFRLISNNKIYNIISQLREGPLPEDKIQSIVNDKGLEKLLENLTLLEQKGIIQKFHYSGETLYLLKADIVLTESFPKYLARLLPKKEDTELIFNKRAIVSPQKNEYADHNPDYIKNPFEEEIKTPFQEIPEEEISDDFLDEKNYSSLFKVQEEPTQLEKEKIAAQFKSLLNQEKK